MPTAHKPPEDLTFIYTNYRGEVSERTIRPVNMWYGRTEWHPREQWFIHGLDVAKNQYRDFAWDDIQHIPRRREQL